MDGNDGNAHCATRTTESDWLTKPPPPTPRHHTHTLTHTLTLTHSSHFSHECAQSLMAWSLPSTALLTICTDFLVFVTAKRAIQPDQLSARLHPEETDHLPWAEETRGEERRGEETRGDERRREETRTCGAELLMETNDKKMYKLWPYWKLQIWAAE